MSKVMFNSIQHLQTTDGVYSRYCTFGKRFTWAYIKCLATKHSFYREPIVEAGGVVVTYYCHKCERRFYPTDQKEETNG